MLENYEEINLDMILERAGLFKNEFETDELDSVLYDNEAKEILFNLFSYDKDIVNYLKEIDEIDLNSDYLSTHRKFIETILKVKNKNKDEEYKKQIKNAKTDYKVERLLRKSDLSYILNKYLKNEPISEELLLLGASDYYLNFLIKIVIDNYTEDIPEDIKNKISKRLDEINKYIPKE